MAGSRILTRKREKVGENFPNFHPARAAGRQWGVTEQRRELRVFWLVETFSLLCTPPRPAPPRPPLPARPPSAKVDLCHLWPGPTWDESFVITWSDQINNKTHNQTEIQRSQKYGRYSTEWLMLLHWTLNIYWRGKGRDWQNEFIHFTVKFL